MLMFCYLSEATEKLWIRSGERLSPHPAFISTKQTLPASCTGSPCFSAMMLHNPQGVFGVLSLPVNTTATTNCYFLNPIDGLDCHWSQTSRSIWSLNTLSWCPQPWDPILALPFLSSPCAFVGISFSILLSSRVLGWVLAFSAVRTPNPLRASYACTDIASQFLSFIFHWSSSLPSCQGTHTCLK